MQFQFSKQNTFCISLQTHMTRWDKMEERFQREGLEVTRWIATTPDTLTEPFYGLLSPNERACTESHIRIWRHQVQHNLPYVFILEDDAVFHTEWRERLATVPDDPAWDLILLNASEPAAPLFQWVEAQEQFLCAGYVLSLRGATQLLQSFEGTFPMSDGMTRCLQQRRHSYCFFPWLIIQDGVDSTLKPTEAAQQADAAKVRRCLGEIGHSMDHYHF